MIQFYVIILNKLNLHLKVDFATGKKSNNKASLNHWNFSWQWPLGRIHISVPGRNYVDGKQLCPLCFVKILSVWSVNTDTKSLGRAGEGNMSHNRVGLGSLLPPFWPLTVAGLQGCCSPWLLSGSVCIDHIITICRNYNNTDNKYDDNNNTDYNSNNLNLKNSIYSVPEQESNIKEKMFSEGI